MDAMAITEHPADVAAQLVEVVRADEGHLTAEQAVLRVSQSGLSAFAAQRALWRLIESGELSVSSSLRLSTQ
jgi:hypothetical protein